MTGRTRSRHVATAMSGGILFLAACVPAAPDIEPPTITTVGLVADARFYASTVEYTFTDGHTLEVGTTRVRTVGPQDWSGHLVILGFDAEGQFVASFSPQGGLPDDCFVENEVGTEWGGYTEIRGVLWRKAGSFSGNRPGFGETYPSGTRFCFNADGEIASIIGLSGG